MMKKMGGSRMYTGERMSSSKNIFTSEIFDKNHLHLYSPSSSFLPDETFIRCQFYDHIWYTEIENTYLKFFGQILLMRILKTNISQLNILTSSHKILQLSTDWLGFADKVVIATAHYMFFNLQTPPPTPTFNSNMTRSFPQLPIRSWEQLLSEKIRGARLTHNITQGHSLSKMTLWTLGYILTPCTNRGLDNINGTFISSFR